VDKHGRLECKCIGFIPLKPNIESLKSLKGDSTKPPPKGELANKRGLINLNKPLEK
jgi:hypothetical protein